MRFAEHRTAAPIVPSGDGGARKPGGNATLMAETVPEAGLPVRNGSPPRQRSGRRTGPGASVRKRLFDIAAASCGLVFLAPLLVTLALLVRLDSRGPALFRQARTGRGGRPFMIYKFRTMAVMEAGHDARQAVPDDPRITRIGRFLRRSSLDELPQFINVLRGEMSVVGPRPIVWDELQRYGRDMDAVLSVRPGLTGLWQVSGRNNLSYATRVRMDLDYVERRTFWLDLHIILLTIGMVLLPMDRGAY